MQSGEQNVQKTATYSCVFKSHPQSAQTLSIHQVSKYCLIAPFSKQHFAVARLTGRTTPLKPFSVHTRILASFALKELNNKIPICNHEIERMCPTTDSYRNSVAAILFCRFACFSEIAWTRCWRKLGSAETSWTSLWELQSTTTLQVANKNEQFMNEISTAASDALKVRSLRSTWPPQLREELELTSCKTLC